MASSPLSSFLLLVILLLAVSAQESVMDTDNEDSDSKGAVVDLGRRGKLVLEKGQRDATSGKNDPGSVVLDLSLDSGLGVFDAFFASCSTILVSEPASLLAFFYAVLYAFFGLRLLYIAWRSDSSKASQKKEMEEVEEELES